MKAVEIAFATAAHKVDPWVLYAVRMSYWTSGLRRCQTFQTMVRIQVHVCCDGSKSLDSCHGMAGPRYVPHASALLQCARGATGQQWVHTQQIAEALCAGFPTIVRRRFGELRPGSAGLVIARKNA
jgi:hypothetical protein